MKITKQQLKKIIKEEIMKEAREPVGPGPSAGALMGRARENFPPDVLSQMGYGEEEKEARPESDPMKFLQSVNWNNPELGNDEAVQEIHNIALALATILNAAKIGSRATPASTDILTLARGKLDKMEPPTPEEEVGEEDIEPLKLPNPFEQEGESAKQFTDRMARRARAEEEEEVPYGMVDPKTGKVKMTRR